MEKLELLWGIIKNVTLIAVGFAVFAGFVVGCDSVVDALPLREANTPFESTAAFLRMIMALVMWALVGGGIIWVWVKIDEAIRGENAMGDTYFKTLCVIFIGVFPILATTAGYLGWI